MTGLGNLLRLPLGKHKVTGRWSEFVPVPGWASSLEDVVPLPAELVPQVAKPQRVDQPLGSARRLVTGVPGRGPGDLTPGTPFPCVTEILLNGAGKGMRDNALFHLALYLYSHGLDEDLALEQCLRANELFSPPLKRGEVETKVKSAYRGRHESARCGTDWLREFCPAAGTAECKGWTATKGMKKDERFAYLG